MDRDLDRPRGWVAPTPEPLAVEPVRCSDGCGATSDTPLSAGWQWLEIGRRWRCSECMRFLMRVNRGM